MEYVRSWLANEDWQWAETDQVQARVVFQTRVWRSVRGDSPGDIRVNEERMEVVRALRRAFDFPDTIGLLDSMMAREIGPELLLSRKVPRSEYATQLRTSLVAVNSHGVHGSAGFKVAESLAAGCAIVSRPMLIELPVPLEPDVHYLTYDSAEECVDKCRYLLDNPKASNGMRERNRQYYRENVHPLSAARNFLRSVFSDN